MKQMKYLSPTSLALYLENKDDFYMTYLADHPPPKPAQTPPMAVGSAFDAFVKSYLYETLFGKGKNPRFERLAIFESQVEIQNRDTAYKAGEYCFEQYRKSGCLVDLMLELQTSITEPRFEFEVMGQVQGYREGASVQIGAVPFLGKPDVYFTNKVGARMIVDWKVNGYYSKYNTSPIPGYVRMRDSVQNYGQHKDAMIQMWKGIRINIATTLNMLKEDWARQLAIYSWLLGEEIGTQQCIVGIDQLVCTPDSVRPMPKIRIAEHRLHIGKDFQWQVYEKAAEIWEIVNSGYFFRHLDRTVSEERQKHLDTMWLQMQKDQAEVTDDEDWFRKMSRR